MTATSETPAKRSHASPPQPGKCLTASAAPPHTAASFLPAIPRHADFLAVLLLVVFPPPNCRASAAALKSSCERISPARALVRSQSTDDQNHCRQQSP